MLDRVALFLLVLLCVPASAAITGVVMSTDGAPVAGARIVIHAIETPEARRARWMSPSPELVPIAAAQTDSKGAFSIASPKEALVDLRVEHRGYEPVSRRVERDEDLGAIAIARRDMKQGLVTAAGKPVANAVVAIDYRAEYLTRTDEQGRYEAPDLKRAGAITVIHRDYAIDEEAFLGPPPPGEIHRTLTAGVTLTGRIVAADGKTPVADASVFVDGWPVATSREDGTFTAARVPAKWNVLTARKDALAGQRFAGGDAKTLTVRLEKAAVISGRITDAKTKVPLAGATVRVAVPRMLARGDSAMLGITDAKGAYAIVAPPGSYSLVAMHPGFQEQTATVAVTSGQQLSKDLSMTQLARVSGVVVDEEKRPVATATVAMEDAAGEMRLIMMMRFTRDTNAVSGPDGRFSIRVPADTDLRLRVAKRGLPQVRSEAMKLAAGERKSSLVMVIPTGIAVTGRMLDGDGNPLSGVAVSATETPAGSERGMMRRRVVQFIGMPAEEEESVRTASDGTFTLRVKEGTYDFTFKREGFAQKEVRAQQISPSATNTIETRLEPAVEISGRVTRGGMGIADVMVSSLGLSEAFATTGPDGSFVLAGLTPGPLRLSFRKETELLNETRGVTAPARDVVVELPVGVTISGRAVEKGTKKPVTSFQAGVAVSRSGGGMMMMGPPMLRGFTSDDGSFTLEHVAPGSVTLIAQAPGYVGGRMNLDVQEGKNLTDVVLELDPGSRIVGKVTGPNRSPLADVAVSVQLQPGTASAMRGSSARATTDANGEYVLEPLEAGEETITFSHPKHATATRAVTIGGRETRLDVQLSAGERVTGIVVTDTGTPVPDAEVVAMGTAGGRQARTNASGAFEIEAMAPGRYRFTAAKNGFVDGTVDDVDISTGSPVRITLATGGTIYGRVLGVAEADLANTTVTVRSGRASAASPVDPQGNYRIDGAPVGTVQVSASTTSRSFSSRMTSPIQTVEVTPGSAQQVNIEFRTDTTVRGRVTRNGVPLAGATVAFAPRPGGMAAANVTTDDQGNYTAIGLQDGDYLVAVYDMQRLSSYNTTHTVRGSGTFDIDFKAGGVRGRVLDAATNEPIVNASVQIRSTAAGRETRGMPYSAQTDGAGAFVLDLIPAGPYTITASRDGYANQVLDTTVGDAGLDRIELRLSKFEGVSINVVDGRDGRALNASASVFDAQGRLVSEGVHRWAADAAHELKLPLAPGTYSATITAFNYAPRSITITSPSNPTVALTPGGTLRVTSKHAQRRRVRLLDASGMHYPRFSLRPLPRELVPGTNLYENLAPGTYTLQLLNDDETVADQLQVVVREGVVVEASI